MTTEPKPKKLVRLNPDEQKEREISVSTYMNCCGYERNEAEQLAWIDLKTLFPRLREYEGIDE